jgi:hypothetical protein
MVSKAISTWRQPNTRGSLRKRTIFPHLLGRLSLFSVGLSIRSIFYFGWVFWAIPSNLIMQRSPPAYYLAFNIFMWGQYALPRGS